MAALLWLLAPACSSESEPGDDPIAKADSNVDDDDDGSPGGGSSGGGGGNGSSGLSPDSGPIEPPFEYTRKDLNHVLIAGQSNSLGIGGGPLFSTAQPYDNVMFQSGVFPLTSCVHEYRGCSTTQPRTSLVPLVEGDRYENENPSSAQLETPASGFANEVARQAREVYFADAAESELGTRLLVSHSGRSGTGYQCLRKGSCDWQGAQAAVLPFEDAMEQVRAAKALADAAGQSYAVRGLLVVHGENNHLAITSSRYTDEFPLGATNGSGTIDNYAEALAEWQRDHELGAQAITGQSEPVPMFASQMTNWSWSFSALDDPGTESEIPLRQLEAHRAAPEKIIVVAPTYFLPFNNANGDKIHLTSAGSRRLGEYFGKAYAQTQFSGRAFRALQPLSVRREGTTLIAKFFVPEPPLVLDTEQVSNPGQYGFSFSDGSASPPAITAVEISGTDEVRLTLAAAPSGSTPRLHYANRATRGAGSGPLTGPRGNLRDSDATPSLSGEPLQNWCLAFDEPVQ